MLTKYEGETQIRNTILLRKTKKSVDSYMTVIGAFKKINCYMHDIRDHAAMQKISLSRLDLSQPALR